MGRDTGHESRKGASMKEKTAPSGVAMHITRGCLVIPIQAELTDESALGIQGDILERAKDPAVKGVIIDVSGVNIIDAYLGRVIFDTAKMVSLLGASAVITGFKPGVVASFIDLGIEAGGIRTAINIEQGLALLNPVAEAVAQSEDAEEDTLDEDSEETDNTEEDAEEIEESDEGCGTGDENEE